MQDKKKENVFDYLSSLNERVSAVDDRATEIEEKKLESVNKFFQGAHHLNKKSSSQNFNLESYIRNIIREEVESVLSSYQDILLEKEAFTEKELMFIKDILIKQENTDMGLIDKIKTMLKDG